MKIHCYCNYTVLLITIHYYYAVIVVLLNEFKLHLEVAVIIKAGTNKPWEGVTLVGRQVTHLSWSDKSILCLLKYHIISYITETCKYTA